MPLPPCHQADCARLKEDAMDSPFSELGEADTSPRPRIIAAEQRAVDDAYRLLDERRHIARHALAASLTWHNSWHVHRPEASPW